MAGPEIEAVIQLLSRLPGLGPRSARRAALHLLDKRDSLLSPLALALATAAETVRVCPVCGNFDTVQPCAICADSARDSGLICVVADVASLWAMERARGFTGRYHVLGGLLSALDGVGPADLRLDQLVDRAREGQMREIILATPATVDGQTTAHYIADRMAPLGIPVSGLAHGVPVGGELDYLDDGTINAALKARRSL